MLMKVGHDSEMALSSAFAWVKLCDVVCEIMLFAISASEVAGRGDVM
jgi:hypothetical protein